MKPTTTRSNTRAVIAPAPELTMERAMELINANHARTALSPNDVYVFRMTLSSQAMDTYYTRMGRSTLENYARDFAEGRALMNSHRSGGFLSTGELPIGRTFKSELSGQFASEEPADGSMPMMMGDGASLGVYAYIQRGLRVTDVSTDDVIRAIEGGTISDVSVGFIVGADGMYKCSICGNDMRSWNDCEHFPGMRYEDQVAFAWIEGGRGVEASLVYAGANPGAMIDKAIRMVEAGKLERSAALLLEDQWGVRFTDDRTFAVIKPEKREVIVPDWAGAISKLRTIDTAIAERVEGAEEASRVDLLIDSIAALQPRAALGDQWIEDLIDQAVRNRVRAEADKFDAERYRAALRTNGDPAYIREEIASWERAAKAVFGDGRRPTTTAKQPEPKTRAPGHVYR